MGPNLRQKYPKIGSLGTWRRVVKIHRIIHKRKASEYTEEGSQHPGDLEQRTRVHELMEINSYTARDSNN